MGIPLLDEVQLERLTLFFVRAVLVSDRANAASLSSFYNVKRFKTLTP